MKLTRQQMRDSLIAHTQNKIPNWPQSLVNELLQVVDNYENESHETTIIDFYSDRAGKTIRRPSHLSQREQSEKLFQ